MFSKRQIISIKKHPDSQLNLTSQTIFLNFNFFCLFKSSFQVKQLLFMIKRVQDLNFAFSQRIGNCLLGYLNCL